MRKFTCQMKKANPKKRFAFMISENTKFLESQKLLIYRDYPIKNGFVKTCDFLPKDQPNVNQLQLYIA